ncbi:TonB-dependent receptor plug domain-containing protein [Arsukibacterium sp.]|uniref:TonB-dependent receptor plug domain-containing protein n=1 Tax=Arsukibacterium sp. TaxID=1977258 RepID=UPI002FDB6B04
MRALTPTPLALAIAISLASPNLLAQQAETEEKAEKIEQIVVTGTRVAGRSVNDTAVPIDIVGVDVLERSGSTELNQMLSTALPSFNFPRPGLADGTDTIRPATLRGLGPDQSLVLVNSKRRHSASLVNVNGTVGRGSSAVDLNTIPTAAIRSVEVLRDGASAQYGSDAIAGVLNVRLREETDGGSVNLSYGFRDTSYTIPTRPAPTGATWSAPAELTRSRTDGETFTLSGWKGFELGSDGFITLSADYKNAERTERGGWDTRTQYPLIDGQFDPREATFNRFSAWYGEPEVEQFTLFANAGINLENGKIYGWASYQNREARSAGFYRPANDARNVIEIHPDGFLPIIAPQVTDGSAALGYQWDKGEWSYDTSVVWGENKMAFTIENTVNRSIGPSSKTEFDAGGFKYGQAVFNFSAVTSVNVDNLASPLNVAIGAEARREYYSIFAGEPDSYRNGGVLLPNGNPTASGAQVFPGFRPSNEVDENRRAVGVFVDVEANITDSLLGSVAIRAEDYSDFGSNFTGKAAFRYDVSDDFGIRGSVQNGFRAPSLQQQNFTATSTNFISGVPFDITTFPVNNPVAIALGAKPLDAEKSTNFSLGTVLQLGPVSLTIDSYQIDINDRIVLSENLTQANVREYLESQGFIGIGGGRFFLNGVDTTTRGLDIVANWPYISDSLGQFDFTVVANYNKTEVTAVPATAELSALNPAPVLFARVNVLTFEKGTPENKLGFITNWQRDGFGLTLRATRYGDVLAPQSNAQNDLTLKAKTLIDIEARYDVNDNIRVSFGADNLLDTYPTENPINLNTTGATSFSNYSPFGRSGRFIYGRVTYNF